MGAGQAVAQAFLSTLTCSAFIDMLKKGKELSKKLILFFDTFLNKCPPNLGDVKSLAEVVRVALTRVIEVFKAFRCLLSPLHSGDSRFVAQLLKYKGSDALESLVSGILKTHDYYSKLWDEVLVKGAASVANIPRLQEWAARLGTDDFNDVLPTAVTELAGLRKQTRAGTTAVVEDALHDRLLSVAKAFIDDGGQGQTLGYINVILKGLHLFADKPGTLATAAKVEKAKTQAMAVLSVEELKQQMALCPKEHAAQDALPERLPSLKESLAALQACADVDLDLSYQSVCMTCLYWHFQELRLRANMFLEDLGQTRVSDFGLCVVESCLGLRV